jgi:predicted transcriptional regulator
MGTRVVTFKMDDEEVERLTEVARRLGITRSEAIRRAIKEWLRKFDEKWRVEPKIIRIYS